MNSENSEWPIFSGKELVIGNLQSPVGVCTLYFPRKEFVERYLKKLMNKVAVVGNLYAVVGLGHLIRNYLANPDLRYLIVTGTEKGNSKKALRNLEPNNSLYKGLFLEESHIKRFLEQVTIVYLDTEDVQSFVDNFVPEPASKKFEPLIVPIPKSKTETFPGSCSGHLIRVETIKEGYEQLLREIILFGHITGEDSEGKKRKELWRLLMVVTNQDPCDFTSIPHPEYDASEIQKYCEDFWHGSKPEGLSYSYGHTLRFKFGDQVREVINAFKKKSETFRAFISLWDPDCESGSIKMEDPPCITTIHLRIINNCLYQSACIRTNDMFNAWPLNAAALRYFQYRLLGELKAELNRPTLQLGDLDIISDSAHVYEGDWLVVNGFLSEGFADKFYPDPKGNFEVKVEGSEIIVNHYSPSSDLLLQTFRGRKAEVLSRKINSFISQTSNTLYVGRELQKAEMEVKKNAKNVGYNKKE